MTLRGALSQLLTTPHGDAASFERVLSEEGFPALPGALLATALATYATSASMAEADAISPLVVGFGPIFDSGTVGSLTDSIASLDPVASIDAITGDAFESLAGTDLDPAASTLLQSLAAIELESAPVESFDVLASLGVDVDLGFGTGLSAGLDAGGITPNLADASVTELSDLPLADTAMSSMSDAFDASLAEFSIDAGAIDTAALDDLAVDLVGESAIDALDEGLTVEAWDAEYRGIAASDPSGDDPAELGLDDY